MWHHVYVHVVWTTRDRAAQIDAPLAGFLCRFLRDVARQERALILEIGLVATHVHLLARLHPTTRLPRLMQRLKGGSSVIAGREHHGPAGSLKWSRGYAIRSVSPRSLDAVREYLRRQPVRHPDLAIPGWRGDEPAYDVGASPEWRGPDRRELR